jgi:hypothetical protein
VNFASINPAKTIFVCGGDDFKMYKMDYKTGAEIGGFWHNSESYLLSVQYQFLTYGSFALVLLL